MLDSLAQLYTDYKAAADEARKKSSVFANILGTGGSSQKHPCHQEFYAAVEKWVAEFVQSGPDSRQACLAAEFLLEEPVKHRGLECYWFMYACMGQIRGLIPCLSKEDCRHLGEKMASLYRKRDRMPVQEDTYKKLLKAGK